VPVISPAVVPTGGRAGHAAGLGLFFIALGVAMIIAGATIANVTVPQIIRDLGITARGEDPPPR